MKLRHITATMACMIAGSAAHAGCGEEISAPHNLVAQVEALKLPIDGNTVLLLSAIESGFDPAARSNQGAIGLMQVTLVAGYEIAAVTARYRALRATTVTELEFEARAVHWLRYCALPEPTEEMLLNPVLNIKYGACYFHLMLQQTQGNVTAALIGYNGGYRQLQLISGGRRLARETTEYVTKFHYLKEANPSCRD